MRTRRPRPDRSHGQSWVAWDDVTLRYDGYLGDVGDDGDESFVEDIPRLRELDEVLRWCRRHAVSIHVRPEWDPSTQYWAGDGEPPPGEPPLP